MSQPDQQHKLLPQPGPWCTRPLLQGGDEQTDSTARTNEIRGKTGRKIKGLWGLLMILLSPLSAADINQTPLAWLRKAEGNPAQLPSQLCPFPCMTWNRREELHLSDTLQTPAGTVQITFNFKQPRFRKPVTDGAGRGRGEGGKKGEKRGVGVGEDTADIPPLNTHTPQPPQPPSSPTLRKNRGGTRTCPRRPPCGTAAPPAPGSPRRKGVRGGERREGGRDAAAAGSPSCPPAGPPQAGPVRSALRRGDSPARPRSRRAVASRGEGAGEGPPAPAAPAGSPRRLSRRGGGSRALRRGRRGAARRVREGGSARLAEAADKGGAGRAAQPRSRRRGSVPRRRRLCVRLNHRDHLRRGERGAHPLPTWLDMSLTRRAPSWRGRGNAAPSECSRWRGGQEAAIHRGALRHSAAAGPAGLRRGSYAPAGNAGKGRISRSRSGTARQPRETLRPRRGPREAGRAGAGAPWNASEGSAAPRMGWAPRPGCDGGAAGAGEAPPCGAGTSWRFLLDGF